MASHGDRFIQETEDALEREKQGDESTQLRRRAGKEFLVRAHSFEDVELGLDDPWFAACVSSRMLGVASGYLRLWPKLSYTDLWYSLAQPEATERVASQLWHRDFDDKHLLKAFLYLRNIDEGAGPFEYVPESQPGGRFDGVSPWRPMGNGRVPEDEVARAVPRRTDPNVRRVSRDDHLLQHERPSPRQLARPSDRGSSLPRRSAHRPRSRRFPSGTTSSQARPTSSTPRARFAVT